MWGLKRVFSSLFSPTVFEPRRILVLVFPVLFCNLLGLRSWSPRKVGVGGAVSFEVDVEVNWLVNDICNFRCEYCYPGARRNTFAGLRDTQAIVDAFDRTGKRWLVYLTGGEPFMMPNFVDLCRALSRNHVISLNSNMAHPDVIRFIETVPPDRVRCVHCSIHMEERERKGLVDDLVDKYARLKKAGFYTYASYVLYPSRMKHFERDYAYLKSRGVIARPKLFRGVYNPWRRYVSPRWWPYLRRFNRQYPEVLTGPQKKQIMAWMRRSQDEGGFEEEGGAEGSGRMSDVWQDRLFIDGLPNYKGRMCNAGMKFVRMLPGGDVLRCYHDATPMGNLMEGTLRLFDTPKPCPTKCCGCPYIGYKHIVKNHAGNVAP